MNVAITQMSSIQFLFFTDHQQREKEQEQVNKTTSDKQKDNNIINTTRKVKKTKITHKGNIY